MGAPPFSGRTWRTVPEASRTRLPWRRTAFGSGRVGTQAFSATGAHGSTPATRSTSMRIWKPGGGLSIGGNFASGPMSPRACSCKRSGARLSTIVAPVDNQILGDAHGIPGLRFERDHLARVTAQILDLLILG